MGRGALSCKCGCGEEAGVLEVGLCDLAPRRGLESLGAERTLAARVLHNGWAARVAIRWWPHLSLCQGQGAGLDCLNQHPGSQSLSHSVKKGMPPAGEKLDLFTQTV